MIDTIRLRSPALSKAVANKLEQQLVKRTAVRPSTGQVLYEITRDQLVGSWDNRIMVQVLREEYFTGVFSRPVLGRKAGPPVPVRCEPYVVVEGSVHKALLGHNIYGGPLSFIPAACWFVQLISGLLEADLPDPLEWEVRRVDWAECFELTFEAVEEYIGSLNNAVYPRRKEVQRSGRHSIFSPGEVTSIKAYHKGVELGVHDLKRLRMVMEPDRVIELQRLANKVLRVETSIKAKKLKADKSGKCRVVDVRDDLLRAVHDEEVRRLLNEGQTEMKIVRTHTEVSRRLFETYQPAQAGPLYGTWVMLATIGEGEVRKQLKRRTFYDHKKKLTDAGCSWSGTDILIVKTHIPKGFSMTRDSPFRLAEEHPEVTRQLEPYLRAA